MAKNAPKDQLKRETVTEPAPAAPSPKKRKRLTWVLLVLLAGCGAGGGWFLLQGQQSTAAVKPGTAKPAPDKPPVYLPLEPFTVNLQQEDASQYLQVGLALKLAEPAHADAIKTHLPEIRNRVLLLLSSKKASEIATLEGKQKLSKELMGEIRQPLAGKVPEQGITSVLFTSFVIQ